VAGSETAEPAAPEFGASQPESLPAGPPQAAVPGTPSTPAVSRAIEQVNEVIEELRRALDEMEEVLETLEFAERQKIDDEREIESLQRSLRRLHRPGPAGVPHR